MNGYLKTTLGLSVCMGAIAIVLQIVTRYAPEMSERLPENPDFTSVLRTMNDVLPFQSILFPLFKYFPFLGSKSKPAARPKKGKERLFTAEQLKGYDGTDAGKGPYLAILGQVYNVRKGKNHYGPGGSYDFFSGRDASRAYVTGDFSEAGLVDDVSGLTGTDYIGLDEWVKFYQTDYKYVGKLIGRYYDEGGEPTPYYYDAQRWISEAYSAKDSSDLEKKMFPPCNTEWNPESGSRFWCTKRSGGIERNWVGVPRKLFTPGQSKSRCACVKNFGPPSHDPKKVNHKDRGDLDHPNLQPYPNCLSDRPECLVKNVD